MKKLIYIEENFIRSPDDCQKFIDLSLTNKGKEMPYGDETRGGDTYLTTVDMEMPDDLHCCDYLWWCMLGGNQPYHK